ncbi:PAAR domain-containing protein [Cupriavidus pauculus]|uniref:PAAR domain-containing protein n=1 Tax=Cupriavidus pauculus TaxID=82633 RepID=UPI00078143BE|nr:PAAR domain-containing protein [Cupriavidus pauculus]MBY4730387.1 PAAR domain-containing protein [Cupriavidus pauculus]
MKDPARLGDPTSHDGMVKTASSTFFVDGRRVALIGDIVTCPKHGDNPITESGEGYSENGRSLAVHGCRSQCGSVILSTPSGAKFE